MGDMASVGEFRDLTSVAAAERFRHFLSERSAALADLTRTAKSAGLDLDGSVPSLLPLWQWIAPQLRPRNPEQDRVGDPSWLIAGHPADDLNSESVALLDGLVSYLGEVFTTQTGHTWELETEDPRSVTYQQPVFASGVFVPVNVLNAMLRDYSERGEADDQLMLWVGATIANTAAADPLQSTDPELEVAVTPGAVPGFDWEIWVDERAESVLGAELFDSLESQFSSIPGVTEVVQEDREIFLVQGSEITQEQLDQAVRNVLSQSL